MERTRLTWIHGVSCRGLESLAWCKECFKNSPLPACYRSFARGKQQDNFGELFVSDWYLRRPPQIPLAEVHPGRRGHRAALRRLLHVPWRVVRPGDLLHKRSHSSDATKVRAAFH